MNIAEVKKLTSPILDKLKSSKCVPVWATMRKGGLQAMLVERQRMGDVLEATRDF
jgi:hypothetical protein